MIEQLEYLYLIDYAMLMLNFTLAAGWILATKFKIWRTCFAGYWVIVILLLLLQVKNFNIVSPEYWIIFHLFSLNAIVVFVLVYALYRMYRNKKFNRRKDDRAK